MWVFRSGSLGNNLGPSDIIWGTRYTVHFNQKLRSIYYWAYPDNISMIAETPCGKPSTSFLKRLTVFKFIVTFEKSKDGLNGSSIAVYTQSYFVKSEGENPSPSFPEEIFWHICLNFFFNRLVFGSGKWFGRII